MRTLHSHLDVNKDGIISYDDFMLFKKRFCDLGHLTLEAKVEFKKVLNVSQPYILYFMHENKISILLYIGNVGRTMGRN